MATIINADNGSVSGSAGLKQSSDASGVLELQTNGTTAITVSTGQNVSFANAVNTPNTFGFKNRIINGDMRIDQRNAGASVTNTGSTLFYLDRWNVLGTASAGQFSIQQVTDAPVGFVNSAKMTVTTTDTSLAASNRYIWMQRIEGYNVSDLGFGTANAQSVTISFWVKSSLTGTFGGSLGNSSGSSRSYVFNYTISSANTWEQKTVTISGDTSGTWPTDNSRAMQLSFSLGVGTNYQSTLNAWSTGNFYSASGATNVLGTNGATWQVTGVQLEKGSTATSFDVRPYTTELQLCQRYFQKSFPQATAVADGQTGQTESGFFPYNTGDGQSQFTPFIVTMRATPTITFYQASGRGSSLGYWGTYDGSGWTSLTSSIPLTSGLSQNGFTFVGSRSGAFTARQVYLLAGHYTASAEL